MPAETLRIMCPNLACKKILAVPSNARGKTVKCRACATTIRIPEQKVSSQGTKAGPADE